MLFQTELFLVALALAFAGGAYHAWRTEARLWLLGNFKRPYATLRPGYCERRKRPV